MFNLIRSNRISCTQTNCWTGFPLHVSALARKPAGLVCPYPAHRCCHCACLQPQVWSLEIISLSCCSQTGMKPLPLGPTLCSTFHRWESRCQCDQCKASLCLTLNFRLFHEQWLQAGVLQAAEQERWRFTILFNALYIYYIIHYKDADFTFFCVVI